MFQVIEYATDPRLAGIMVEVDDEHDLMVTVLGDTGEWYFVTLDRDFGQGWWCTCPAWWFSHEPKTCKHIRRVEMFLQLRRMN
jgi:hypothetical protein